MPHADRTPRCGSTRLTTPSYLVGIALCVLAGAPLLAGVVAVRRLLLPTFRGAPARLAEAVLALTAVLVVGELLGAAGWLYRWPLVGALGISGLAAVAVARATGPSRSHGPAPPVAPVGRAALVPALAITAVAVAHWTAYTLQSLHQGILNPDSLWYHLAFAARFVHTHSITALHFTMSEPLSPNYGRHSVFLQATFGVPTFYPANSSLLHAAGILVFGSDFPSTVVNLGFLALALLAAWCLGRPFGAQAEALVALAPLLVVPAMITTQPGSGMNDVVVLALFLASAALLVNGGVGSLGAIAVGGLAAGLAVGSKLDMFAPIAVLTIALIVLAGPSRRRATSAAWILPAALTGSGWYIRNLADAGNPVPYVHMSLGPLSLPRPDLPLTNRYAYPAIRYLTDTRAWREVFRPQLHGQFGPGWYVLLLLCAGGSVLALARGRGIARALGAAGLAGLIAFPFTPLTGAGPAGYPYLFQYTLRYLIPPLGLGAILLVTSLRGRIRFVALAAYVALFVAIESVDPWPSGLSGQGVAIAGALLVLGGLFVRSRRRPRARVPAWAVAAAAVLAAVVLGAHEASVYRSGRYANGAQPMLPEYAWAGRQRHARIALVGFFSEYPFYGRDFSNRVQFLGRPGAHGAYFPIDSCTAWRKALAAGGYRLVVVAPQSVPTTSAASLRRQRLQEPIEAAWTRSLPGTVELMHTLGPVSVFRLGSPVDDRGCSNA